MRKSAMTSSGAVSCAAPPAGTDTFAAPTVGEVSESLIAPVVVGSLDWVEPFVVGEEEDALCVDDSEGCGAGVEVLTVAPVCPTLDESAARWVPAAPAAGIFASPFAVCTGRTKLDGSPLPFAPRCESVVIPHAASASA